MKNGHHILLVLKEAMSLTFERSIKGQSVKGFCTKLTDIGRLGREGGELQAVKHYTKTS